MRFNKLIPILAVLFVSLACIGEAVAKKTDQPAVSNNPTLVSERIKNLTRAEREQYEALSDDQKQTILSGRIDRGFNKFMVILALGQPYFMSENHPIKKEHDEVWLYTKPQVSAESNEQKIIDSQTGWPSIQKNTKTTTCSVGDFFVLIDRGVVSDITKDKQEQRHGECVIETKEEIIPIVENTPKKK